MGTKISDLTALTGTGIAVGDLFPIVDVSASTSGTKKITAAELLNGLVTANAAGTALTGANTATDDQFMIYDLSATAAKYITRAELYEALRLAAPAATVVAAGSTLSVTAALHGGKIIALDTATGSVCTLPVASGTGNVYTFITKALATSNSHIIKVADASGLLAGVIHTGDNSDGTATAFATTATSDTCTLNRTTTGSVRIGGDRIVFTDIATNVYSVSGCCIGTGGEATPFSATV
ncbi:hypothetical protein UFOVP1333_22 [uncultured Caudovirales phage]|uniref:Uncharacterized protein n=1 Tax=uncultured Caudovirales phage TaxID=2100421 RepID=A0A6J5S1T7_9CAUD|nr:hypothetical protein UFOVP1333_22 [uncultured Caudovirales phage]